MRDDTKNGCVADYPIRETDLLFDDLLLPEIFTFFFTGTSGVTRSLSRLYTGRDQCKTAFVLGFYFYPLIYSLFKWRNSTRELGGFSIVLTVVQKES